MSKRTELEEALKKWQFIKASNLFPAFKNPRNLIAMALRHLASCHGDCESHEIGADPVLDYVVWAMVRDVQELPEDLQ